MTPIIWLFVTACSPKVSFEDCEPKQDRLSASTQIYGVKASDHFGQSIAIGDVDGDGLEDVLVGSPNYDPNSDSNYNAGMATIFLGRDLINGGTLLDSDAALTIYGVDEMEGAASMVGMSDVDGDGLDDLWIGANQGETSGQDTGLVYLFYAKGLQSKLNGSTQDSINADVMLVGEGNYDYAGFSMANAGDVDGDKLDDWLIGAHKADAEQSDMGKVYLFFASTLNGLSGEQSMSLADVTFVGEAENDFAGYAVAGGSDVDKDGLSDIMIGSGDNDANGDNSGAAYLFLGASLQPGEYSLSRADVKLVGSDEGDVAGRTIVSMPSADGNRRGDWAIASSWNDEFANNAGKVSIITGDQLWSAIKDDVKTVSLSDAEVTIVGSEQEAFLGQTLAVGDLDGDKYSDLLIGSPLHDDGTIADAGVVHLFFGASWQDTSSLSTSEASSSLVGAVAYDSFGISIATGDIDDDGLDEILLGTPYADEEELDAGGVSIFFGCE
jgi:hypothetical protein